MANQKEAYKLFETGLCCGQITATFLSEVCGNDADTARASTGGFGAGMNCGEVCGAVSGSVYSMGVYCNHCKGEDTDAMEKIIDMTTEFTTAFKEKFGSLRCCELAPDMDMTNCLDYIVEASRLAEEIIERDKNK